VRLECLSEGRVTLNEEWAWNVSVKGRSVECKSKCVIGFEECEGKGVIGDSR